MGVMDEVTGGMTTPYRPAKMRRVRRPLTKQDERWRFKKGFEIFNGVFERGRRVEYPWMGHDPQEFIHTGPRERPRILTRCEFLKELKCRAMKWRFFATGIYKDIGIEGNQVRPSIKSKRASRSSRRTPGNMRPFSVRHFSSYLLFFGRFPR